MSIKKASFKAIALVTFLLGRTFFLLGNSSQIPLFTPNEGQFESQIIAKATLNSTQIWITQDGIWFQFFNEKELDTLHDKKVEAITLNTQVVRLEFKGANWRSVSFKGVKSRELYHYLLGNNPNQWKTNVSRYGEMYVKDIFPNIDLQFIATTAGLKYNWILRPNAKIQAIQSIYHGATLKVKNKHEFEILSATGISLWNEVMPEILLQKRNQKKPESVDNVSFVVEGNRLNYDLNNLNLESESIESLTIDPFLVFSTYSGSLADNFGCTGTYDNLGNAYSGGTVFNFGLPVTTGAVQVTFAGGKNENLGYGGSRDVAILKFNTAGNNLLFCTYLGGQNNEQPHSMVVDSQFNLFIMGTTRSTDFPVSDSAYDKTHNGDYDFFITRLNANGTALLGSTFLGSFGLDGVGADRSNRNVNDFPLIYNYADEFRGEIIERANRVYIGGVTYSTNFPHTVNTPYPTTFSTSNGVMFAFDKSLGNLQWSHVIGTAQDNFDAIYGIALNDSGIIYGAGGTYLGPNNRSDFQNTYGLDWKNIGTQDISAEAIIIGLDINSGSFKTGRYYGTTEYDQAYFVQTDNSGRPYIFGQTEGNMAGINARYHDDRNNGQFITRFNKDLSNIELQSCFGANGNLPNISPSAFLVDRCERIFISGWGGNTNSALYDVNTGNDKRDRNRGNTRNLPLTPDAIQKQTDGSDFYIAVFAKDMYDLAFATYFGGITRLNAEAEEHVDGGTSRFDKKGIIYQSLCGGCRQNGVYPTTPGAWSRNMPSPNCNNAMFKIDFENLNRPPSIPSNFVEVIANDVINVSYTANDPDLFDTVNIIATFRNLPAFLGVDTPVIETKSGIGTASISVNWATNCGSVLTDTLIIDIMVFDCGCPEADTTYHTLKILVKPVPEVPPPDAICVLFERFQNRMRIEWPSQLINSNYFNYFLLIKTNPNGTTQILDTIRSNNAGFFIDTDVVDPHIQNYCYEMIGVNICDVQVAAPYKWCSVSSLNSPLAPVHLINATVFEDKRVDVRWETSREPEFKDFEVYRYKKGSSTKPGVPFIITKDTFLSDSSFDVDFESYCYEIVVTDKCGHISNASNPGCNVVLKGTSKYWPDPYFDLDWDDYRGWKNGVENWRVERKHDGQTMFEFISNQGGNRNYRDADLDYDWGGYWFRVTGNESVQSGQIDYQATTESNWIYLIQPPEVWVPDVFTVNNDGINEVWGTFPLFVKNYSMNVYDRWGNKIWESTAKKKQWDGFDGSQQVPDGVYAWLLRFDGWDGKSYQKTGTVMVIH